MRTRINLESYLILTFFTIIYLLWLFKTYSGNYHSAYFTLWDYNLDNNKFANDYFIQNTNQFKISIIWTLHKFLKIDLNNDLIGFLIHLIFSSLSGYFLFMIITKNFKIKSFNEKIVILFSILTVGNVLIFANKVSWVINHTATPTYFAHSMMIIFVYFYLNSKNQLILLILSSFLILSQLRVAWFPIGVCIFHSMLFSKKLIERSWIIGPIFTLLYLFNLTDQTSSYDERIMILKNVLSHSKGESDFNLQSYFRQTLLIFSFFFNYYFIIFFEKRKILKTKFIIFLKTLLFLSIFVFAFAKFYTYKGYLLYPFPEMVALSFTRGLTLYELFFWLLLATYIYFQNINLLFKSVLYLGIFYIPITWWGINEFELRIFYGLFIFCLIYLTYAIIKKKYYKKLFIKNKFFPIFFFIIFLSPGVAFLAYKKAQNFNFYSFKLISKWTSPNFLNENEKLNVIIKLKKCKDFILYDYEKLSASNLIAKKSQYIGSKAFNHFDLDLAKIHEDRLKIHRDVLTSINEKKALKRETSNKLRKDNVYIVANLKDMKTFVDEEKIELSKNYYIVFFNNKYDNNKDTLITNCLKNN
tara:strand:+ start:2702 stop:4453 length:1752 start_codon:yes stop_codon:yes gene_type:complete